MIDPVHPALAYIDPTGGLPPALWGPLIVQVLAVVALIWGFFKFCGRQTLRLILAYRGILLIALSILILIGGTMAFSWFRRGGGRDASSGSDGQIASGPSSSRILILALDGLDPQLLDQYMKEGRLPNFSRLAKTGIYHPLKTVTPPQSPVAWASFVTATDPGHTGIYDFLKRDPETYLPDLTIADRARGKLPWSGKPFWNEGPLAKLGFVGIRVPMTFPPTSLGGRLLAGMGVWDVRGTEGTYFYYSDPAAKIDNPRGKIMDLRRDGSVWHGEILGPYYAGKPDTIQQTFDLAKTADGATLTIQGRTYSLHSGRWSDWVTVEFRLGVLNKVSAVTRVLFKSEDQKVSLYVSPLNFDPSNPMYPISQPKDYSAELAKAIGPFHTRGMPFDTVAVDDGVLTDDEFLDQVRTITDETERMLFHELPRFNSGLLFAYFETSDVVQHMFWRGIDSKNAIYDSTDAQLHRQTIPQMYEQFDALVGRVTASMDGKGTLLVISDHGFAPYRWSVHVNSVLRDLGYLTLKSGQTSSDKFFEQVDWSRTKAYAIGFNSVFLNLAGREGNGIVMAADVPSLTREIAARLESYTDPLSGERPFGKIDIGSETYTGSSFEDRPDLLLGYNRGYRSSWETALGGVAAVTVESNRKKWSGDHLIDPRQVPGVYLSSNPQLDAQELMGVGPAINAFLTSQTQSPRPAGN